MKTLSVVLLLSSLTFAQTTTKPAQSLPQAPAPNGSKAAATEGKPTEVPPTAAVITIHGFCPGKQETGAACKTEISREQFEKLSNALDVPDARKLKLATAYAQMLAIGTLAEERGIASNPQNQEILKFARLQTLVTLLAKNVHEEAAQVPAADVQKYYEENKGKFAVASLKRIFIPKNGMGATKPDEASVKAEASKLDAAAKAPAADFTKLQKEAYTDMKMTATPPPVDLNDMRRDSLPPSQQNVFDLTPGTVSAPIDENGGVYIYKMVSKTTPELAKVEPEIKRTLEQERFQSAMTKIVGGIKPEFNPQYFSDSEEGMLPPGMPPAARPGTTAPPATKSAPATPPKK